MALLPMQEIFILLEDEKKVPLYRLNRWGKQARGVLAKLTKLAWVEKFIDSGEIYYRITQKGEKAVDKLLSPLKASGKWDGRWRLVMFDIPEKKRAVRDQLRRDLAKLGLGILQASVWISPNDIKAEIEKMSVKYGLEKSLRFFEMSRNENLDKTIIEKSWNLPELTDAYKKFNFQTERLLKNIGRDPNPKFAAKKMVFELALIMQQDPYLPIEFRNKDLLRNKTNELYKELRSYIV